jgi:Spy/CpxP family protein refolding chaperone
MSLTITALATFALMATPTSLPSTALALTQGPGRQQGGQGGPGGPGGPGGRVRPMGAGILLIPPVIEELNLSETQIDAIRELLEANRPDRGDQQGPPRGRDRQGPPAYDAQKHAQMMSAIQGILNAKQFRRFSEIELQMSLPMGLIRPDVAQKLSLSQSQSDQIRAWMEANRPPRGGGGPGGPGGGGGDRQGPPPGGERGGDRQQKVQQFLSTVLSDAQQATLKSLLGAPFRPER